MTRRVSDAERARGIDLIAALVRAHPVYGSAGIFEAQALLEHALRAAGCDAVVADTFAVAELSSLTGYVDVSTFGPDYAADKQQPKINVLACVDSGRPGPTLVLNGHIDVDVVVDPHLWASDGMFRAGVVRDGRLFGRGAVDMLGGLVAQVLVLQALARTRSTWRGRVVLCSVVDEEIGGNGTLRSLTWLRTHDWLPPSGRVECVIAEPTGGLPCTQSLGFLHLLIEAHGKSCHMGALDQEDNAIVRLARMVASFETAVTTPALRREGWAGDRDSAAFNFGVVRGGIDAAVAPGRAHAEGTLFFPPHVDRRQLTSALDAAFRDAFGNKAVLRVGTLGFDGASCANSALDAIVRRDLQLSGSGIFRSPCDQRLVAAASIPTLIFGPGALDQAHAVDEALDLAEWDRYVDDLTQVARRYLEDG